MLWELQVVVFGFLIVSALIALEMRDMLAAVTALGIYSLFAAVLLTLMGAVDVAFTEAVLGAGVIGVLLVTGILGMERRSRD